MKIISDFFGKYMAIIVLAVSVIALLKPETCFERTEVADMKRINSMLAIIMAAIICATSVCPVLAAEESDSGSTTTASEATPA